MNRPTTRLTQFSLRQSHRKYDQRYKIGAIADVEFSDRASKNAAKGERETILVKASNPPSFLLPIEWSRFSCSPPFQSIRTRFRPASGERNICAIFPDKWRTRRRARTFFFISNLLMHWIIINILNKINQLKPSLWYFEHQKYIKILYFSYFWCL